MPKGKGIYYIPVHNKISILFDDNMPIKLEVINSLSRINHESPYSKDNPIRKIDFIKEIDITPGLCGVCVVAMLVNEKINDVLKVFGSESSSWSKIKETLDYYGILYKKNIYPKGKNIDIPKCAIIYDGGFKLWYKGKLYGSASYTNIISYLEIEVS